MRLPGRPALEIVAEQDDPRRAEHESEVDRLIPAVQAGMNPPAFKAQPGIVNAFDVIETLNVFQPIRARPTLAREVSFHFATVLRPPAQIRGIEHVGT